MATLAGPPADLRVSRQARSINNELIFELSRKAPNMTKAKIIPAAAPSGTP